MSFAPASGNDVEVSSRAGSGHGGARKPCRCLASSSRHCIQSPAFESPPLSLLVVCEIWIEFVSGAIDLCFNYSSVVVAVKILRV
jgi:hypothetical protein